MSVADAPSILRAAGLTVAVESTWPTEPLGPMPTSAPTIVWHHDASPPGPSLGALGWIMNSYAAKEPSAQFWVDTAGVWHCIGKGLAYHAGKTNGMATNHTSVGIETDHTTGEDWPDALLGSLRRGTAALLTAWGHTAVDGLFFHKQIAIPLGRKQDPDGLDIYAERAVVQAFMTGPPAPEPTTPTSPTPDPEELTVADISAITAKLDAISARLDSIEQSALNDRKYMNELPDRLSQVDKAIKGSVDGLRAIADRLLAKAGSK